MPESITCLGECPRFFAPCSASLLAFLPHALYAQVMQVWKLPCNLAAIAGYLDLVREYSGHCMMIFFPLWCTPHVFGCHDQL